MSSTTRSSSIRAELREWLAANYTGQQWADPQERHKSLCAWQHRLWEAGWLGLGWPTEYGGHGGDPADQIAVYQELALAKAPLPAGLVGLDVIGPTIVEHGSEEQKKRFIRPLLAGDEIWCQAFSEPEAGSDLASLRTTAVLDGDAFVVNGQKIWTSMAEQAHWCAVLVRTNLEEPKHKGISYLLTPMDAPGITVRPVLQITGASEFGEVFFDNVRIPRDSILGGLNNGWRMAMATLVHERGIYTLRRQTEMRVALDELTKQATEMSDDGQRLLDNPVWRRRLGRCEAMVEMMAAQGYRTAERAADGDAPAESSVDKVLLANVEHEVLGFALDLLGSFTTVVHTGPLDRERWLNDYFFCRTASIYGGTGEIQRNIITTSILELPRT